MDDPEKQNKWKWFMFIWVFLYVRSSWLGCETREEEWRLRIEPLNLQESGPYKMAEGKKAQIFLRLAGFLCKAAAKKMANM